MYVAKYIQSSSTLPDTIFPKESLNTWYQVLNWTSRFWWPEMSLQNDDFIIIIQFIQDALITFKYWLIQQILFTLYCYIVRLLQSLHFK